MRGEREGREEKEERGGKGNERLAVGKEEEVGGGGVLARDGRSAGVLQARRGKGWGWASGALTWRRGGH